MNTSMNLETFSLLWLDGNVNTTDDNIQSQIVLRETINFLRTFDQAKQCEEFIRNIKYEKIVLIVSGRLGREIVPRLHDLSQLNSVYVYCFDKDGNKKWARNYSKVKGVFIELRKLIQHLVNDQQVRDKHDDPWSIMIYNRSDKEYTHKNLKSENSSFMWFQLLIEALLNMQNHSDAKKELIQICRKQYEGNAKYLSIVDEFQKYYHGENAIWWYTRDSCLYRLLNKALRIQNIDILFAFRFFIKDLLYELTREHVKLQRLSKNQFIRVFRGQIISTDEFKRMKKSIGEFISINSFFSASQKRNEALDFAQVTSSDKTIQRILFEIEIDVHLSAKPFADVADLSYYKGEAEVLFMLGSIFRITNINYDDKDSIWVAHLSLCNDSDHDLRDLLAYQKDKICKNSTNAVSLGDVLFKMGEFEKAKRFYNRILNEKSTDERLAASCYFGLGNVAIEQDDPSQALTYHTKALEIKQKFLVGNHRDLASSYNQIGMSYNQLKQFDRALNYTQIALQMRLKGLEKYDVDLAQSYRQFGVICYHSENNNLALPNLMEAHLIYTKALPENHPDIAENLGYIGYVYGAIGDYNLAFQYLDKCLQIQKKTLPEYHADIGVVLDAIGSFLVEQHKYNLALHYFNQSLTIFRKSLAPTHRSIRNVESKIEQVKSALSTSPSETN